MFTIGDENSGVPKVYINIMLIFYQVYINVSGELIVCYKVKNKMIYRWHFVILIDHEESI